MNPAPRHPRFILQDEMDAREWTVDYVAEHTQLEKDTIRQFLRGDHKVTDEIAIELGHLFGTSPSYWLDLQHQYERKKSWNS